MKLLVICSLCLLINLACKEEPEKPSPAPIPKPAVAAAAVAPAAHLTVQPEYTIEIKPTEGNPPTYVVSWSARVNTGGWKLTTDTVQVEDQHSELRVAKVYATLVEPGPGTVTTQAFTTLTDKHDAGPQKVDRAELHVRRSVLGVKSDYAPLYGNVKSVGKAY